MFRSRACVFRDVSALRALTPSSGSGSSERVGIARDVLLVSPQLARYARVGHRHDDDAPDEDDGHDQVVDHREQSVHVDVVDRARDSRDVPDACRDGVRAVENGEGYGEGEGAAAAEKDVDFDPQHRPLLVQRVADLPEPVPRHRHQDEGGHDSEEAVPEPHRLAQPGHVEGEGEANVEHLAGQRQTVGQQVEHAHRHHVAPRGAGFEPSVVHEEHDGVAHQTHEHQHADVDNGREKSQRHRLVQSVKVNVEHQIIGCGCPRCSRFAAVEGRVYCGCHDGLGGGVSCGCCG